MTQLETAGSTLRRAAEFLAWAYRPGERYFYTINQVSEHSNGCIALSGPMYDNSGGMPLERIGLLRPGTGLSLLHVDQSHDREPTWSPDGRWLAYLSDRGRSPGQFQLFVAPLENLEQPVAGPNLEEEIIESFVWSADSRRILLQTAHSGADAAASSGSAQVGGQRKVRSVWTPRVENSRQPKGCRRARIWSLGHASAPAVGLEGENVWEASWCGEEAIVAIISQSPTEGGWYQTRLAIASAAGGSFKVIASPSGQLAKVTGSPDGRQVAVLEGRFHRGISLGPLALYEVAGGTRRRTRVSADVSCLAWRDSNRLFFAGVQGQETVTGTLNTESDEVSWQWRSTGTAGSKLPAATLASSNSVLAVLHAFDRPPYLARIDAKGTEHILLNQACDNGRSPAGPYPSARQVSWRGRDGLEITGYVVTPPDAQRPPVIAAVHGGPCHLFRNAWSYDNPVAAFLVRSGFALFCPNPRGSTGRGLEFASKVYGDWGGEDTQDILSGLDHVIAQGGVDGRRQLVMGGSYGGYMTAWLVGQTDRFVAACAFCPGTHLRSLYFTAHHPEFLALAIGDSPYKIGGLFDQRNPLTRADRVRTPTLLIAGDADRTTLSEQALEFYHALVLNGVDSELAIYPNEGHRVMSYDGLVDECARVLSWFERYAGPTGK